MLGRSVEEQVMQKNLQNGRSGRAVSLSVGPCYCRLRRCVAKSLLSAYSQLAVCGRCTCSECSRKTMPSSQ